MSYYSFSVDISEVNTDLKTEITSDAAVCRSTSPQQGILMGVSQIWVHEHSRRRQIATTLLDTARREYIYGYIIPRAMIAFTSPTPAGKLFAQKYTGTDLFLVYS